MSRTDHARRHAHRWELVETMVRAIRAYGRVRVSLYRCPHCHCQRSVAKREAKVRP